MDDKKTRFKDFIYFMAKTRERMIRRIQSTARFKLKVEKDVKGMRK
jgi:hypothetical protein